MSVHVCGGHSNLAGYRLVRGSTVIGVGASGGVTEHKQLLVIHLIL